MLNDLIMKQTIFLKLKQEYAHLGLGDSILQAHADSLNAMGLVNEDNLSIVISSQRSFLENLQREADRRANEAYNKAKANSKEIDEGNNGDNVPEWYKSEKDKTDKLIGELKATIGTLNEKNEAYERERATAERNNRINELAKELGIPKFRIEEGFAIADNADDEAIKAHLTSVANNIKTQLLPSNKNVFPQDDGKVDKATADSIAESLI